MKVTKKQTQDYIKNKLATDKAWAKRGILRIFERQTASEQMAKVTMEDNGVGFSGCDAEFMTSLATQLMQRGDLSPRQWEFAHKKISKYSGQIMSMIEPEKLTELKARIGA